MRITGRLARAFVCVAVVPLFIHLSDAVAQPCVDPPADLISWWPGEGNADDVIGGNHGTLVNGARLPASNITTQPVSSYI